MADPTPLLRYSARSLQPDVFPNNPVDILAIYAWDNKLVYGSGAAGELAGQIPYH